MKKKCLSSIFLSMCLNNLVVFLLCSAIVHRVSFAQDVALDRQPGISVISQTDGHAIHSYFDTCPESPNGKKIVCFLYEHSAPGFGHVIVADRDGSNMVSVGERIFGNAHDAVRQKWIDDTTVAYSSESKWETYLVN